MLCSFQGKHGCYTDLEYIMPYHLPNATHCNDNDSNTFILTVTFTFSRFSGTSRGINTHIKRLNFVFLHKSASCLAYTLLEKRDFILNNSKFRYKCYPYWASSLKEKKLRICLWEKCVSLKWHFYSKHVFIEYERQLYFFHFEVQ